MKFDSFRLTNSSGRGSGAHMSFDNNNMLSSLDSPENYIIKDVILQNESNSD